MQQPTIRTESAGSVEVGEPMFDTAIVAGAFPVADDVEFRVRFAAYERGRDGRESCEPGAELRELGDPGGVVINGPGRYESRKVRTSAAHIGLGGYVETLVMVSDGTEHVVAIGKCGAPSERFEVRAVGAPALAETGFSINPALWWWGGGAVAVVGALSLAFGLATRKRRSTAVRECGDMR